MSDSDSDTSSSLEAFPDAPPLTSLPDESAQSVLSGSTGLDSMASINRHILGMTQGSGETQFMSFTHRVSARRASEPVTMFSHFDREDSMGVFDSFVEDLHERAGDITQETISYMDDDDDEGVMTTIAARHSGGPLQSRRRVLPTGNDDDDDSTTFGQEDETILGGGDGEAIFMHPSLEAEPGLPELIMPEMFFEVPQVDPISELLARHGTEEEQRQRNPAIQVDPDDERTEEIIPVLVSNNAWRALAKYAQQQLIQCDPRDVDEIMKLWYCRILALCKLRLYKLAQAELDRLGELDRPELYYDSHPGLFPNQSGSMVPFELRVLHAQLPACLGNVQYSIDRVYALIVYCKRMAAVLEETQQEPPEVIECWKAREAPLMLMVCRYLMQLNDYASATSLMRRLVHAPYCDIHMLAVIGRLHLQMGNLLDAERMFAKVESLAKKEEREEYQEIIWMNNAYMAAAIGDWPQALDQFKRVLERNPENETAANNLGVCQLYHRQLSDAKNTLRRLVTNAPRTAGCSPPIIFNLCALYELRSEASYERKRRLMCEVAQLAGDDMPAGCFKLSM